jgi:hypothetical protein
MPKAFSQMVSEALAEGPAICAAEASEQMQTTPNTLGVDARDPEDITVTGIISGASNVTR